MHRTFRFSLVQLLLLTTLVAVAFWAWRIFWEPGKHNYHILLGIYLGALSVVTVGVYLSRPAARGACLGTALFGWTYLALVLRGGFGITTMGDAISAAREVQLGLVLAVLVAATTHVYVSLFGKSQEP